MLRRRENLPLSKGGRSPTPPRRQIDMPDDANCICSCLYVLGGLCLIGMGYLHCMSNSAHARLRCVEDVCTFSRDGPNIAGISEINFLRENLLKAEVVQLDREGNVIKTKRNRRPKRGTPQTLTLTWKDGETQDSTTLPLTTYGLARKAPKKRASEVNDYLNKKVDELDIDESKFISGIGILCFVFGGLLVFLRFIIGAIAPPPPSRRTKAAAAPRKLFT